MYKVLRAAIVAGVGVFAAGCSTSPFMALEEVTDEALSGLIFPAPTQEMNALRSKYIAATVAMYGAWAVTEHSGERLRSDADAILGHLVNVGDKLEERWKQVSVPESRVGYTLYVDQVFEMIDAAARPARRRYREAILGAITSGGVGAAGTAFQALKNILTVERYREAIAVDAQNHATRILCKNNLENCGIDATEASAEWQNLKKWACDWDKGTVSAPAVFGPGAMVAQPREKLPNDLRQAICQWPGKDKKIRPVDQAWTVAVLRGDLKPGSKTIQVADKDWKQPNEMLRSACKSLAAYAGKADKVSELCLNKFPL